MSLTNLRSKFYVLNEHVNAFSSSLYDITYCLIDFYENHPAYSRIAWNTGSVGGGLNSNGFPDSIKDEAWFIYRNNSCSITYDIAIKVGAAYPASSWKSYNNSGLSVVAAWHSSSQAWSGSLNNNGSDNFTVTPWKSGSITTLRSNGDVGSDILNKNGMLEIYPLGVLTKTNVVITGTNDYTIMHIAPFREANDGAGIVSTTMFLGKYEAISSSYNLPLCQGKMPVLNTVIGDQAFLVGGGLIYTSSQVPGTLMYNVAANGLITGCDKTLLYSENSNFIAEFPLWLTSDLSLGPIDYSSIDNGFKIFGTIPDMNVVSYHASGYRFYRNGTRLTIKSAVSDMVFSIPWDSGSLRVTEIN